MITRKNGTYVDCTTGEGGHSQEILKRIGKKGVLIGIDRDADVLAVASARNASYSNFKPIRENFINIYRVIEEMKINTGEIDGILFDLGVSSFQIEDPGRGFAFKHEGPLDMRMSPQDTAHTAADLLSKLSFFELRDILFKYGEERHASRIARAIVDARVKNPLSSTSELADMISRKIGRRGRIHPATRTFQALRIVVNKELENLEGVLDKAIGLLRTGGRLCVISFHSLEDRIVKNKFRSSVCLRALTKKPVIPSAEEVKLNPRSRSSKLRAAEKIQGEGEGT